MNNMMNAVRQNEAGGKLVIETIPIPEPGPGEVLVKMAAAPINPSDLASITGDYMVKERPFTPGLEGSGTVVKAGPGFLPRLRMGKRVACSPLHGEGGTWARYMRTSAMKTVPLPGNIEMDQGAMMLVNPMTAMAFIQLAREGKHAAMVNNAAASSLGKMLIRLAAEDGIPLVSIVRRKEQLEDLRKLGATHVLDSSSETFIRELTELSKELNATLFLDAVSGKETGRLLSAAPGGASLVAYARLSGEKIQADPSDLIRLDKNISGFQLGNWLNTKSTAFKLTFLGKVKKRMASSLSSHIHRIVQMEEVNEAIESYRKNMSAGKVLLRF